MYYAHFGLIQPPYKITPDTGAFFCGGDRGDILSALIFAIKNGEAITKVVGEVGSGKTMLCRMLQDRLPKDVEIAYLSNPNLSPENVLPAIAIELGIPIHQDDASNRLHIMKTLEKYLLDKHSKNQQVVVLVEEAQGMPLESLEEIRLLSNLETKQHKLLQVVLFGQPELDHNLSAVHVRQIRDRITHSLYLPPIKLDDIREYLMFRVRHVGYSGPSLFSKSAVWLIARFSKGLIRRVNILADKALLAAYANNASKITWNHVLAARGDSEFGQRANKPYLRVALIVLLSLGLGVVIAYLASTRQVDIPAQIESQIASRPSSTSLMLPSAPVTAAKLSPADISTNPVSVLQKRREATILWLAAAKPTEYSIQILQASADSELKITQFLQQAEVAPYTAQLFIYDSVGRDNNRLNVLYGRFETFSNAEQALKALPDFLKQSQPYIRNMRDILNRDSK